MNEAIESISDMSESAKRRRNLLIMAVALGTLMNPLNSSMIAVALSRLQEDFNLTFLDSSWLISTYYLASAIGQPVMGMLSDRLGRKRLFMIGLSMIAIASALAPLSPSFGWLIGFRIIQAIGSSILFPSGMGIIRSEITSNQAQSLAVLAIFNSTSAAFGPSVGGFMLHFGDWPAIFLVNFPIILGSFVLAVKAFPRDKPNEQKARPIDWAGILIFSMTIVSWLLFLLSLSTGIDWYKLLISIVLTGVFILFELRMKDPFIDVSALARNTNLSLVYVQFILVNIVFYSIFFGVPTYLQKVQGFNSSVTGIVMLSVAGFGVLISPFVGKWIDLKGSKPALVWGSIAVITGSLLLLTLQNDSTPVYIFAVLSVMGLSNGLNNLAMQTALYSFVQPEETGAASGLFMTSRFVGTILSSSLLGLAFGQHITSANFHIIAATGACIGVVILLLSIRMPSHYKERGH
jgi:EmrB/QacA subfamily drug resistance transporter